MRLAPFLLDRWLDDHDYPSPEFNLGGSTGPRWTLGEVFDLEPGSRDRLFRSNVVYAPSAGAPGLREAIAAMSGVDSEHVLVVAGGSEALLHVFFDAAERGANVLVPFPGFPPYAAIPEALGIEVRPYRLRREAAYRIDFDEVERLADRRTTLLLVNSPHNPTGATLDASDMRRLHDFAADRGIQFISDEVFHPIYHGPPGASAATLPHATVIGDLSKAFSLSGLRLGWIVERNEERRARYINARRVLHDLQHRDRRDGRRDRYPTPRDDPGPHAQRRTDEPRTCRLADGQSRRDAGLGAAFRRDDRLPAAHLR